MKRSFSILFALVIAFFTLPFASTVAADGKVYDDIEDGEYEITANALKKNTNESSTAAQYMDDKAILKIDNNNVELTLFIPKNDAMEFKKLELDGIEPSIKDSGDSHAYTFKLKTLVSKIPAVTTYEVPFIGLVHENVKMDFELIGLDDLPIKADEPKEDPKEEEEESQPTEASEERVVGNMVTEDEADAVYELNYETDSKATAAQLSNPVKLLEKDSKKYIQIPINENGAQFFRSLKINDKEVTWNSITEGPYVIQFELPGKLEDTLDLSMVIQAGPNVMLHENIGVWFDTDSIKKIKEKEDPEVEAPKEDPKENPVEDSEEEQVNPDKEDPKTEPQDPVKEEDLLKPDKAHEINYVIKHENGIQDSVANQFFTGKAKLFEKNGNKYVQLTISNGEMVKELSNKYGDALLVEKNKDGSIVVQLRVDNNLSDMLLSMRIVVPAGAMPGFDGYDMKHDAILVFDKDSMKEIDVSIHKLAGTNDKDNQNAPFVEDNKGSDSLGSNGSGNGDNDNGDQTGSLKSPQKPGDFGDNGDGKTDGNGKIAKTDNPKTGDTSKVLLYAMLLIGSFIPLAIKMRRRFA